MITMADRAALVNSGHLIFQNGSQHADLCQEMNTQNGLIAFLKYMVGLGYHIEVTAVKSDHHDDSSLGEHCHYNGYAIDCWPLSSNQPGDYVDASTAEFRKFLEDAFKAPNHYQTGLGGSAYTSENMEAAGSSAFEDDGADHVHFGAHN